MGRDLGWADVVAAGFDETECRDPNHERTWIVLVDGNNATRCGSRSSTSHKRDDANIEITITEQAAGTVTMTMTTEDDAVADLLCAPGGIRTRKRHPF